MLLPWIRKSLFGVPIVETTFARRKFVASDDLKRERLEKVGATFLEGYHLVLSDPSPDAVASGIEAAVSPADRGFAFEGAGMAFALLDALPFGSGRLQRFLEGPGDAHVYMVWIGAGWAIARLGGFKRRLLRIEPLMRPLAVDGIGFHMGYFQTARYVEERRLPEGIPPEVVKSFDQGLGRCLWFVEGADVDRVVARIATFPGERHGDLWAGIGLACSYAGGASSAEIERLSKASARYASDVAQGSAFALMARRRAMTPAEHTARTCEMFWGRPGNTVADLVSAAGENLPQAGPIPPYEVWRQRIKDAFAESGSKQDPAVRMEAMR